MCRRVLASPDFQLLVRCREPCDCASGEERGHCCHKQVRRSWLRDCAAHFYIQERAQRVMRLCCSCMMHTEHIHFSHQLVWTA